MRKASIVMAIAMAITVMTASAAMAAPDKATCYEQFHQVHGFHIVSDYVVGIPSDFVTIATGGNPDLNDEMAWPPKGGDLNAKGGAVTPGGPGPGFHFPNGVAPGASFCNDSNSPGAHLPPLLP